MRSGLVSLLILLALTAIGPPADATQASPSYYFIDGHRLQTIGPALKALRIAYDQYSGRSPLPPWRLLAGRVVDVARRTDGSYAVDFFADPRSITTVPAFATAAAQVTLSNPYYKMIDTKPSITLLGADAAALLVAAQVWDGESNRIPFDPFFDLKSRDIANYGVFLGMIYLQGKMYYTVVLSPLYFPCLPRCTVAASDWQIRIDAQTFEPGHFQSVGYVPLKYRALFSVQSPK